MLRSGELLMQRSARCTWL